MGKSSDQSERNVEKRTIVTELMEREWFMLHVNTAADGLVVPSYLLDEPVVKLQIGKNVPNRVPHLQFDEDGVKVVLSFNQQPFKCEVPWSSIFAVTNSNNQGLFWRHDAPDSIGSEEFKLKKANKRSFGVIDGDKPTGIKVSVEAKSSLRLVEEREENNES